MTHLLYLSLGSNLGNRHEQIHRALKLIEQRVGSVLRVSKFIETEPWGFKSPNLFLNAACLVQTSLSPRACLLTTQQIEKEIGRKAKSTGESYQDRPIDIDLLMYDHEHVQDQDLVLPHPHMKDRDFVLIPLQEIMEQDVFELI